MKNPLPPFLHDTYCLGDTTQERAVHVVDCPELASKNILMAGLTEASSPYTMTWQNPPHTLLAATLEGEGNILIDGKWLKTIPGEIYLAPLWKTRATAASAKGIWKVVWILYSGFPPLARSKEPSVHLATEATQLARVFEGIHAEINRRESSKIARLSWIDLLDEYARLLIRGESKGRDLSALWRDVDSHLDYQWTLDEMAQRLDTSQEQLRLLVHQSTGYSPMAYVTRLRMQRAVLLLSNTDLAIGQVANEVGYRDQFAFSTAFRRYAGHPPSTIKKNRRRNGCS